MSNAPKDSVDTAAWLPAARAGSNEALGLTLQSCRRYLLWVARRELGADLQAKAGASDLVQETLLDAGRDFAQFHGDSEENLLAWLRRILLNNLANFVRNYRDTAKRCIADEVHLDAVNPAGGGLSAGLASQSSTPPEEMMEREQIALLEAAVARLPDEQRKLIMLWHREEKSFEEIARMMNCSPNTVRARWMQALKRLKRDLQEEFDPQPAPETLRTIRQRRQAPGEQAP